MFTNAKANQTDAVLSGRLPALCLSVGVDELAGDPPSQNTHVRRATWAISQGYKNNRTRCGAAADPNVQGCAVSENTGSVDPGSGPIFGSASGSEIHILGIAYAKDTFYLY